MGYHGEMTGDERMAAWRHVAPFLVWVVVMSLPVTDLAIRYAIQAGAAVIVLAWVRPWRYYTAVSLRFQPWAVLVGAVVCAIWVLPESPWMRSYPGIQELYYRLAVRGGDAVSPGGVNPYAPGQCGWWLTAVRLTGSAFVISLAEEYFWRGFLMRWMQGRPFTAINPGHVGWGVILVCSIVFGLEHSRWAAGIAAGLAYGLLYSRTRDLGAAITAHVTTNLLLGLYVLFTGAYAFW